MSYPALAEALEKAGRTLRGRSDELEGTALASAAEKLQAALRKFDDALAATLRGFDPDVKALRSYLEAEDVRAALDIKTIKLLAKKGTGRALTVKATDTPEDQRWRLLEAATKQGRAGDVLVAIKAFIADRSRPAPRLDDREGVLAEVRRLGKVSKDDLAIEKESLLGNEKLLRAMADAVYIKTTSRTPPKTILTKLVHFAQRVQENIS